MPVNIFNSDDGASSGGSSSSPSSGGSSSSGGGSDIMDTLKRIPWWGYAAAGGVVLGIVVYLRRSSSAASSGINADVSASQNLPPGLGAADLAGLPFDYMGYSAAFNPSAAGAPGSSVGDPTATLTNDPGLSSSRFPGEQIPPTQTFTPGPQLPGPGFQPRPPTGPDANPPQPPAPQPHPSPTPPPAYYHEVHAWPAWDSTLSGIAGHYGMSWQQLYNFGNDRQIVDSAAHAHGHYGDEYNWLFPGEEIQVPSNG